MSTPKTLLTADELLRISEELSSKGLRCELIRGELIEMAPVGGPHSIITSRIDGPLGVFARQNGLGEVLTGEPGFILDREPDTVRAPDIAFISRERLPQGGIPPGYVETVPDLVVEVVSPSNTAAEMQAKVEQWISAGVRLVWVVYPDTRSIVTYRALDDVRVLTTSDQLLGEPAVPGFSCSVEEIFRS